MTLNIKELMTKKDTNNTETGIRERMMAFIDAVAPNQSQFAKSIGLSSGHISAITVRGSTPGTEFINRVAKTYPKLNMNWLIKGEGSMYETAKQGDIITATVTPEGEEIAVFVPIPAQAGYLTGYGDPRFLESLPGVVTPFFKGHDIRLFEVQGDSMEPTFYERDIVFGQRVYDMQIHNGRVYVVVSKSEGIVIKRVQLHRGNDYVTLYSDNKFYEPQDLPLNDIAELWYFRRKITAQAPPPSTLEDRVYEIEKYVFDLKKALGTPKKGGDKISLT